MILYPWAWSKSGLLRSFNALYLYLVICRRHVVQRVTEDAVNREHCTVALLPTSYRALCGTQFHPFCPQLVTSSPPKYRSLSYPLADAVKNQNDRPRTRERLRVKVLREITRNDCNGPFVLMIVDDSMRNSQSDDT
jgi:hypothetical protein